MQWALLTANCEVFVLDEYVVKTNVEGYVGGYWWWRRWRWCYCFIPRFIPGVRRYIRRAVLQNKIADNFRLLIGFDNNQGCALLLAVPASFSPDCGRLVGEPET
jgi:hypothetical protein